MTSKLRARMNIADAEPPLFAGVDVGGTSIKLGIVDNQGRTVAKSGIPTLTHLGPQAACQRFAEELQGMLGELGLSLGDLAAIGLGSPGTMDIPRGMLLEPPNLHGWEHFPLRDRVSESCGNCRVAFANDANAAAFGEFWVGSGREYHSIVLLTLGTGVGGGIIIGDLSVDGENSHGSECGHIIIDYHADARLCGCGHRGHLEAYASATALLKRAEEALLTGRPSRLSSFRSDLTALTPLLIGQVAEQGDELARELVLDTAMYLGVGITSLMHTIDPAAVILGGAMTFGAHETPLGREFLGRIRQEVQARCFPVLAKRTTIDYASLGGDAGFVGAAGIARMQLLKPQ